MKKNTKKIVFINNIVAPYRIPLFNKLNDEFSRRGVLFEVVFLSENESVRDWKVKYSEIKFKYEILPVLYQRRNNRTTTSDFILNSGFFRYLFYDYVVMFGYNYPTYLMISIFRRLTGRETILFSESTIGDKLRSVLLHGLKKKLVKNIYSKFIVPGAEAKMFICGYGIDKTKVRIAENAVIPLGAMAKKTNSNKDIVIIFVGRLSREKNVEFLIKNIPKTTGFNFKLLLWEMVRRNLH